ncbi:peptidoglycan-binding protein [Candidatus Oscillochloris fontis]|uniref:peptidoglycan-binding protein n=1 Tax=Candidatus Oscillochloris fontis TaxID=2496868 RepID=UPI00101D8542|nr:peptidoglycan-binding protein [Candidatus Oscillochloris fontis]
MMRNNPVFLFILLWLLTACGTASPPSVTSIPPTPLPPTSLPPTSTSIPPSPVPTLAQKPTDSPSPLPATPVPVPTATLAVATGLPAPVYLINYLNPNEQIVRLEPDGATLTQISFESQPVRDLSVAQRTGTLVYLVGDEQQQTLVALDGSGRRELLSGQLGFPRISPDGQTVALRITGQPDAPDGIWALPVRGGRPSLVLADGPNASSGDEVWIYTPVAYAPNDSRLLLWAYDAAGPAIPGGQAVVIAAGQIRLRTWTCCEWPVWSTDGTAITVTGGGPGPDMRYGLVVIDLVSGAEQPVLEQSEDSVPLVTGARQLADGQIYALHQQASYDDFSWEFPFTPQLARVAMDGRVIPVHPQSFPLSDALWREDGSGALLTVWDAVLENPIAGTLTWVPSMGGAALRTEVVGSQAHWADTDQPLYAGDCSLLPQIGWQPPASRVFSAGAADLQARLNALGLQAGAPDGYFGDQTRTALEAFQASRNLPTSPTLDCATWQALLGRR